MVNNRKNKLMKNLWVTKEEYKKLTEYLDGNYVHELFDLMTEIYERGDIC